MTENTESEVWHFKSLRYGGTCVFCGATIDRDAKGWHNPMISKVRCTPCGPVKVTLIPDSTHDQLPVHRLDPVGGTSTLMQFTGKNRWKGIKGATGEYLTDQSLHKHLTNGEVILTDRRVPEDEANIDHVVVASSGVWIIDSKKWEGKIVYKSKSLTSAKMRLTVGGHDRTESIQDIYKLVIPVATLIGDRSVPIHPALAFVEGDWSARAAIRTLGYKPYNHEGVWLTAPFVLTKMIQEPGPLTADDIVRISTRLDQGLTPRWPA